MLNELNHILVALEDAIDSENWELVKQVVQKIEGIYERIEISEQYGESYDE